MITYNGFSLNHGGMSLIPKDEWGPGPRPHPIPDWVKEMPPGSFRFEFTAEQSYDDLGLYWAGDSQDPHRGWSHVSGYTYQFQWLQDTNLQNLPYGTKIIGANLSGIQSISMGTMEGTIGLVEIDNFYGPDLVDIAGFVRHCKDLSSVYGDFHNVTDFGEAFRDTNLSAIPAIDFSNAIIMSKCFMESNIQWIRGINAPNLEYCSETFQNTPVTAGIEKQYSLWSGTPAGTGGLFPGFSHVACFRECVNDPYYYVLAENDPWWI